MIDCPTLGTLHKRYWSEGHQCGICFNDFNLRDTDLGTMDTTEPCRHIFCHFCPLKHEHQRIKEKRILECPTCRAVSADIIRHHERRPGNEVEVITDAPTGCCDWVMDTTSSTGNGNRHEERCICLLVHKKGAQTLSRGLARSSLLPVDT